ncbi:MAG: sulfatase-like hydrolase/transferase, partial [Bacteroidota bacterium]|nr:sulfatase-like hydrolase/transferase [Bacteroidota bacterium]
IFLLVKLSLFVAKKINSSKKNYSLVIISFAFVLLFSQSIHIYASAKIKTSVLESSSFLPYYFPISMNSTLDKWGIIDKKNLNTLDFKNKDSKLNYPLHRLEYEKVDKPLNIIIIAIDSWNYRTLNKETMPNTYSFMQKAQFFSHHLSSSNGTRGGLFGLMTALSPYYWKSFEYSSLRPIFFDELERNKYTIQLYPSATLKSPPFDRVIFKGLENVNTSTIGKTSYERDCNITNNFIKDLPKYTEQNQPFFTFLFYDLPHAISLPKEKNKKFQPSWDYADYSKLNNNIDPLPFYNLYRNCVYQVDSLIGLVLGNLEKNNLLKNSVIVITGDHGQEFNENHKNYWGHSGNYSKYQIQVPLIFYYPNIESKTYAHQTTHYDVIPTLMNMFLGVKNPLSDYSMGKYLYDNKQKAWHIVGNDLNYAFITQEGY